MSYEVNLEQDDRLYIIPRGCDEEKKVIICKLQNSMNKRVHVYFSNEDYQVITDKTLRERRVNLQKYIEQTESWRK